MSAILGGYELVETIAGELGVAASTVHEWCRKGRFPCRRAPHTRRYLIPRAEVPAWAEGAEMEVKLLAGGGRIVKPKNGGK